MSDQSRVELRSDTPVNRSRKAALGTVQVARGRAKQS